MRSIKTPVWLTVSAMADKSELMLILEVNDFVPLPDKARLA